MKNIARGSSSPNLACGLCLKATGPMANPLASRAVFTGNFECSAGSSFGHTRTSFDRGRCNSSVGGGSRPPLPPAHSRNLQLFRTSPQALTARSTEVDFVRDQHTGQAADIFGYQVGLTQHWSTSCIPWLTQRSPAPWSIGFGCLARFAAPCC